MTSTERVVHDYYLCLFLLWERTSGTNSSKLLPSVAWRSAHYEALVFCQGIPTPCAVLAVVSGSPGWINTKNPHSFSLYSHNSTDEH